MHSKVKYAQQLFTKLREKRYPQFNVDPFSGKIIEFRRDVLEGANDEGMFAKGISPELLSLWDEVKKVQNEKEGKARKARKAIRTPAKFNDNLWSKEWYLVSIRKTSAFLINFHPNIYFVLVLISNLKYIFSNCNLA